MWFNLGPIGLLLGLAGYLVANRIDGLRRYRWLIVALGIFLFSLETYIYRAEAIAALKAGWEAAGPLEGSAHGKAAAAHPAGRP